ncbi:hypothetical protein [Actinomadura parmotrematis]|uniref:hypothetical protein n=1 Tax=Actinomadura parmotrematis TaxID=2864039 RepID=UPI00215D620E|nr:hypothetical protein [Actinomadura parmotrematis]
MDDPRAAWRTVAGVALTGFVAGFLGLLNPPVSALGDGPADRLDVTVPGPSAAALADRVRGPLAGLRATVAVDGDTARITVPGGEAAIDRARTVLARSVPGAAAIRGTDTTAASYLLADLRTGSLTVLAVSFVIAVTSAGISGASAVLDRRRAYASLALAGTPLAVLDRARRQETLIPLAVMGGGSLLTGAVFASPFGASPSPGNVLTLLACVTLGVAGILGAGALSRPLLRSMASDPSPNPD